jgi:hypothetical protein
MTMRQSILIFILLLIPIIAIAQTAEEYLNRGIAKINLGQKDSGCLDLSEAGEMGVLKAYDLIKECCQ